MLFRQLSSILPQSSRRSLHREQRALPACPLPALRSETVRAVRIPFLPAFLRPSVRRLTLALADTGNRRSEALLLREVGDHFLHC
jgi:hypothetical protein